MYSLIRVIVLYILGYTSINSGLIILLVKDPSNFWLSRVSKGDLIMSFMD